MAPAPPGFPLLHGFTSGLMEMGRHAVRLAPMLAHSLSSEPHQVVQKAARLPCKPP